MVGKVVVGNHRPRPVEPGVMLMIRMQERNDCVTDTKIIV